MINDVIFSQTKHSLSFIKLRLKITFTMSLQPLWALKLVVA